MVHLEEEATRTKRYHLPQEVERGLHQEDALTDDPHHPLHEDPNHLEDPVAPEAPEAPAAQDAPIELVDLPALTGPEDHMDLEDPLKHLGEEESDQAHEDPADQAAQGAREAQEAQEAPASIAPHPALFQEMEQERVVAQTVDPDIQLTGPQTTSFRI